MAYTVTNTNTKVTFNFSRYSVKPLTSVSVDFLDTEVLDAVNKEDDLTISPDPAAAYAVPYPSSYSYLSTGISITGLTAYPNLGATDVALARTATILAKNLDYLKSTLASMQTVINAVEKQTNAVYESIFNTTPLQ